MDEDKVTISRLVLDKVLLAVDAEGYVALLDPVRVRTLVGQLPEGVKLWLLGAGDRCPRLCEAEHFSAEERETEPAKPRAARKAQSISSTELAKKIASDQAPDRGFEEPSFPSFPQGALDAVLLVCGPFSKTIEVIAGNAEVDFAVASRALVALKARGLVNDNVSPGAYFITADGRDAQDALALTPENADAPPAQDDAAPASAEVVLGAMLESKPQTVSQIASFLGVGVARVAPTIEALVAAGKVEQAKGRGRFPQYQKVAA